MSLKIHTHFLPSLFDPAQLAGQTAVVIDVLRASTTICHALAAGANAVVPCRKTSEAKRLGEELTDESPVLGGEREGRLIAGFELDNSPLAYTEEAVGGKTVVFTTTNGTQALSRCSQANRTLIGTFNNLAAVVEEISSSETPIHLVCAGTDGQISQEDVLFAGSVAAGLSDSADVTSDDDDPTNIARTFYLQNADEGLAKSLANSRGGRNLRALGLENDIARAAEMNRFDFVPVYSTQNRRITR